MNKETAITIIRQFASDFESKKEFEWLVEAMIFIDKLVEDQQKEIEEKTTILLAGAEKVKQLEEQIKSLKDENDFLRFMYKGTDEYKAIEKYASGDHIPRID